MVAVADAGAETKRLSIVLAQMVIEVLSGGQPVLHLYIDFVLQAWYIPLWHQGYKQEVGCKVVPK